MNKFLYEDDVPLTVEEIKSINFDSLSKQDQLRVKQRGRPTPQINLSKQSSSHGKMYTRRFKDVYFKRKEWLCASDVDNALYCFPCLVFNKGSRRSSFVKNGFKNIGCLSVRLREHECTKDHIDSLISLKLLSDSGVEQNLGLAQNKDIIAHNARVKKNLEILNDVISAIFFLGAHELPFRGSKKGNNGIFLDLLELMSKKSTILHNHLNNRLGSACKLTSPDIQNQILDSVVEVYRQQVLLEISQASYVSVMADESVDISGQTQLVIVFRYINNKAGLVVDRLWGYFNPYSIDADGISKCLLKELNVVIRENDKLISQTFDGFNVVYGKEKEVQSKLKKVYNRAHYTHCHGHQMQLVRKDKKVDEILLELRERSKYLETFHLAGQQLFRKDFFCSCSELELKELYTYIYNIYPSLEICKLQSQFEVYYERDLFYEECLFKVIEKLNEDNLKEEFSEVIKLAQILITIPINLTDAKKKFSSMKTLIKKHCNKMVNNKLTALGILLIEKNMISGKENQETNNFQKKVVENFIRQKPRKMDFFYKCQM